jgi:hypothetical protein
VANKRRRKKQINVLDGPAGPVTETTDMIPVATGFYKYVFKWDVGLDFKFEHDFFTNEENVTREENDKLDCRFT